MKKYNDRPNAIGSVIAQARKRKGLSKTGLCRKLELLIEIPARKILGK